MTSLDEAFSDNSFPNNNDFTSYANVLNAYNVRLINNPPEIDAETANAAKVVERYKFVKSELKTLRADIKKYDESIEKISDNLKTIQNANSAITSKIENSGEINKAYTSYISVLNKVTSKELQTINENITSLMDKLHTYESEMNIIRDLVIKIDQGLDDADKNKNLCPICFDNEVNLCANPCGHTVCSNCNKPNANNLRNVRCHTCRANVTSFIKIFFSV